MRVLSISIRRVPRLVAFVVPTAVAMTLAACGSVTGPSEQQAPKAKSPAAAAAGATQLDTADRGPVQPWY
jgi:hypothetical protein